MPPEMKAQLIRVKAMSECLDLMHLNNSTPRGFSPAAKKEIYNIAHCQLINLMLEAGL